MPDGTDQHRHFILTGFRRTERFQSPQRGGGGASVPDRNRRQHGTALLQQIQSLERAAARARQAQEAAGFEEGFGLRVEFESFPDIELAFESLARERSGIELLNVRHEKKRTSATVFVPDGRLEHFERLIRDYLQKKTDKNGRARDHRQLVNAIRAIRTASLRALWTDDMAVFPTSDAEALWWEVWLAVRDDREASATRFRERALAQGFVLASGELHFPERTVLLAFGSADQMKRSVLTLNGIAELRRAKETADFFDAMAPAEQAEWLSDLLDRTRFADAGDHVPRVCLLDTGVNRGHALIAPALADGDLHTVEPGWGTDDTEGHGTMMAGLALVGDLKPLLSGSDTIDLGHRLESVKLLRLDGGNAGDAHHHGYLTSEAVARPEISAPTRRRLYGMAVTARDYRDRGRPSAWSAAVDRLASDADNQGEHRRLLVISAGNVADPNAWAAYPASNDTDAVHDPAQAWNALTVGACTDLCHITETDAGGYAPVAAQGGLSPFSTTSLTWQAHWPIKPDVVLEGGNAAKDSLGAVAMPSLSLLTTHHQPASRLFTTANATSASTALAARMSAQIMATYPTLWPETVRGLIVHSAEWTECMRSMYLPATRNPSKGDYLKLIRRCGFGVPDLERALWSVANSLTMVVQDELQPFKREGSHQPALRDMHLHRLPWPNDVLEALGETTVEMRVTLSYFIEPNPSERGIRSRYRYESHGLRFDVRRPGESVNAFRARVNAAARDEEEGTHGQDSDPGWIVGKQNRHKGSLHSDTWQGTAADLASRGTLAVYPALGWWKTRPRLERYDHTARYTLIISIKAPGVDVDLYSEVANEIGVSVSVEG